MKTNQKEEIKFNRWYNKELNKALNAYAKKRNNPNMKFTNKPEEVTERRFLGLGEHDVVLMEVEHNEGNKEYIELKTANDEGIANHRFYFTTDKGAVFSRNQLFTLAKKLSKKPEDVEKHFNDTKDMVALFEKACGMDLVAIIKPGTSASPNGKMYDDVFFSAGRKADKTVTFVRPPQSIVNDPANEPVDLSEVPF